jgi:AsmA protein
LGVSTFDINAARAGQETMTQRLPLNPKAARGLQPDHRHVDARPPQQATGGSRSHTRRRPEQSASSSVLVSLVLWGVVTLAALAVGTASFLFILAPTDLVRDELIHRVKARSGRDLTIAGPTSFSLYPNLSVAMRDVALSGPPGMAGRPAVSIELLEATISLWPLLQRRVELERLVLRQPVIELRVDSEGRRTWELAKTALPAGLGAAQPTSPDAKWSELGPELRQFVQGSNDARLMARAKTPHHAALQPSSLVAVHVENGTVRYANEPAGVTTEITSLELQLGLNSLTESLDAKGSFVWRAERVAFDANVASLRALLEAKSSVLALGLSGRALEARYEGSLRMGSTPELDGLLTVRSPSVSGLARWLDPELSDPAGVGPLTLSARLKTVDAAVAISDLDAAFEGTTVTGSAALEMKGPRPYVTADLQISELDLPRFALLRKRPAPADDLWTERQNALDSGGRTPPSIEDLLRRSESGARPADRSGPQHNGFNHRADWDQTELNLSWLGRIDADARLAIGRLLLQQLRLGPAQLTLALKDRVLSAAFDDVQLYEGRARGNLSIDAAGEMPAVGANLALDGISALPLLKDAAGIDWLAGNGKIALAISGQGRSERQIVGSLAGTAEVGISDGAVVGFNISKLMRGLERGRIPGFDRAAAEKTEFSELAASFTIENGVAQNRDLRLASPLLRVAGAGTINLPARQLDYTVRSKLVAPSSQGGAQGLAGIELPAKVTGAWDKPSIAADVGAVVKDPQQVVDTVKQLGRRLKGTNAEAALRNLLGGGSAQDGSPPQKPSEVLRKLLKGQVERD